MINDRPLSPQMADRMKKTLGGHNVFELPPPMGGEDFAYFSNEIPGFFFRPGVEKPGTTSGGLLTQTMTADNEAVPVCIRTMTSLVLEYLSSGSVK